MPTAEEVRDGCLLLFVHLLCALLGAAGVCVLLDVMGG